MTALYEPRSVVSQIQSEINRVFGTLNDANTSSATAQWVPAVDVAEYTDHFEILVDLPGVEPNSVDITLDNGVLSLSGSRQNEKAAAQQSPQQQRFERQQGRFYRRFILPDTVDTENVRASGRNGVLEISIAKHPKAQPRRISVT